MQLRSWIISASALVFGFGSVTAFAQSGAREHRYDALGRLVSSSTQGGNADDQIHALCYDEAGNRISYESDSDGTPTDCSEISTPAPSGPQFSIGDASAKEGDSLVFTVTRIGPASTTYSVSFATADGSAGSGDYTAASGTLSFSPTQTTRTISVVTQTSSEHESNETFYVNLSSPTGGATILDGQGEGKIRPDECFNCHIEPV